MHFYLISHPLYPSDMVRANEIATNINMPYSSLQNCQLTGFLRGPVLMKPLGHVVLFSEHQDKWKVWLYGKRKKWYK